MLPAFEGPVKRFDENPKVMQFLERGAPLEGARAEKREGGDVSHQDNCVHVGLCPLKGCLMAESQRSGGWRRKREGRRHKSTPEVRRCLVSMS